MATLKTKIGEVELVDNFDTAIEFESLANLIDLWESSPEDVDPNGMANYFKQVSAEKFVYLCNIIPMPKGRGFIPGATDRNSNQYPRCMA